MEYCRDEFWNLEAFWNSTNPNLTECAQVCPFMLLHFKFREMSNASPVRRGSEMALFKLEEG